MMQQTYYNPNTNNRTYKLLGVYFDEYLNFDKHVSYICAKLAKSIFCIKCVSKKLSLQSLKALYYALVHPHLQYCINIISCTSAKNIARIVKLQKKAVRIITKSKINKHTGPLFIANKILPFEKLIIQYKLLFMHSVHYDYAPKSFNNTFTKNVSREINYELRNVDAYLVPAARIQKVSFIHFSFSLE